MYLLEPQLIVIIIDDYDDDDNDDNDKNHGHNVNDGCHTGTDDGEYVYVPAITTATAWSKPGTGSNPEPNLEFRLSLLRIGQGWLYLLVHTLCNVQVVKALQ